MDNREQNYNQEINALNEKFGDVKITRIMGSVRVYFNDNHNALIIGKEKMLYKNGKRLILLKNREDLSDMIEGLTI